jgi:hypothetical protein
LKNKASKPTGKSAPTEFHNDCQKLQSSILKKTNSKAVGRDTPSDSSDDEDHQIFQDKNDDDFEVNQDIEEQEKDIDEGIFTKMRSIDTLNPINLSDNDLSTSMMETLLKESDQSQIEIQKTDSLDSNLSFAKGVKSSGTSSKTKNSKPSSTTSSGGSNRGGMTKQVGALIDVIKDRNAQPSSSTDIMGIMQMLMQQQTQQAEAARQQAEAARQQALAQKTFMQQQMQMQSQQFLLMQQNMMQFMTRGQVIQPRLETIIEAPVKENETFEPSK